MRIYIFKGTAGLYALTPAADGSNLPTQYGPWAPHGDLDIETSGSIKAKAMADIRAKGFYLTRVEIQAKEGE